MIPKDHPRYKSLLSRDKIVNAYKSGILADAGMIAHGRGEAFDYLIGEKTTETAKNTAQTAAAALILAKNPEELKELVDNFDNINNLKESLIVMLSSIEEFEMPK